MELNRWKRIEGLFHQAIELPPRQRRRFLREACGGDDDLATTVLALLDNLTDGHEFERLVQTAARQTEESERLVAGTRLGPYAIDAEIGRGGMGAVYRAERADGLYQQTVAIKLVQSRRMQPGHLDRFRAERQILAKLEHPNIARLLDGGTTDDGLPYFVMEFVDGQPVDAYCTQQSLTTRDRLRLFLEICSAVQFAHQKLIIHGDLKPSNVFVTTDGEVRLLDFGIAKLLEGPDAKGTDKHGDLNFRALTPWYSSPEQIRGDGIATTSDVFTLGVLLHELLTGELPFETNDRIDQRILSGTFGSRTARVAETLATDLRCILSKALQSDQTQRYASATQMAEDIERYLANFPVAARAGSWSYKAGKFYARNRVSSALATLLLAAVAVFSILTSMHSRKVAEERDLAQVERDRAEGLSNFLIDTLVSVTPDKAQGEEVTVREVLDNATSQLDQAEHALAGQSATAATLRRVIGAVYESLGLWGLAEDNLVKALQFHRAASRPDGKEFYRVLQALYRVEHMKFDHERSLEYLEEALQVSLTINGPDHPDSLGTQNNIAGVHMMMGELDRAESVHEELYQRHLLLLGPEHPDTIASLQSLAIVDQWQGEYETAKDKYEACLALAIRVLGERHTSTLQYLSNLGNVLETMDNFGAARPILERHIDLATQVLGENHPATMRSMHSLADVLRGLEQYEASEALFLETLSRRTEHLGPKHIETLQSQFKLGRLYGLMGRRDEALVLVTVAVEELSSQLGPENPTTLIARQVLADLDPSQTK